MSINYILFFSYVSVNCLAFDKESKYICLCSDTETVHVFKLEMVKEGQQSD